MTATRLLTKSEAATRLQTTPQMLAYWSKTGGGPPVVKLSHKVLRYPADLLEQWVQSKIKEKTT